MEANELRIGNFVYYNNELKSIGEVTSILNSVIKGQNFLRLDYRVKKLHFIENINPIPLTEEWLLKCKSNSIFNNGFEYKKTSTGRFEVYVGVSIITILEFVHELQNLNFAILGEELIFDEL